MACKQCGICCNTHLVTAKKKDDADLARFRKNYMKKVKYNKEWVLVFRSECKHLKQTEKGGICRIYGSRPRLCKIFPTENDKELWKLINPDCGLT